MSNLQMAPLALEAEDSLADARSSYRAAVDLLDGYVHESHFLRDDDSPDNHIVWASDGFKSIFGCSFEEYNRAKTWGGFYHREEIEAALERARALRRGEVVEAELRVLRTNGQVRWLYVKNRPIVDPATQRVIGILGIGQDITQRKEAEKNLRGLEREIINIANREQQRIAHDLHDGLCQELTGIAMMLRSTAGRHGGVSPALSEALEETIGLVNRSIQEARTLARGLSPLETGYGGLVGALNSLAAHARDTVGVDARFDCSRRLVWTKSLSNADDHLYRIASEAVHNALRHSGAKCIRVALRVRANGLVLKVRDNGRGLPDNRSSDPGMGMRIMEYRAHMIGGRMSVESAPQRGTSIECFLPVLPDGIRLT
jgi:two-component system, NarL family, sensor histidine kinase UhpB